MSEEKNMDSATISRNAPCPCGSGKKYKLCCGAEAVAAEREAKEKKSPFWTPDGVTAEVDDTRTGWPNDRPKWTMTLPIEEDGDPAEDARCVIEKLVRPYFDRYCELEEGDDVGHREMAIVECFAPFGDPLVSSPLVTKGREGQLWDMLLEGLENLLSDCHATETYCEVRWDRMSGGPIVRLEAGKTSSTFFVTFPDEFGKNEE